MNNKKQGLGILVVAMSLATAWAIRGQFGHEQGAAWAGAVGAVALVLVANRKDWYSKMPILALASALGWGAGGMISYGVVVGYGKADNFINAFYGLSMLFVIGALFGLLGGGLVGLVLDSTKKNRVNWGALVSEMVAGGLLTYFFLIEQIGFKMTPPRSEAWALILGAGLAMLLHMARTKRNSAIRVAIFAALGGGFGFGFGNFLQVVGNVMEIPFNMWNVMEYSIGFFGGLGMAYGVFSSSWPIDEEERSKTWINRWVLFILLIFIPLMVYRESLTYSHFLRRLGEIPNLEQVASTSTIFTAVVLVLMAVFVFYRFKDNVFTKKGVSLFLFVYLSTYALMSYLVTGLFAGKMGLNHHLYLLNIVLIFILSRKEVMEWSSKTTDSLIIKKWFVYLILILAFLAVLSLIAISSHGELPGSHNRFEIGIL
ncbi:photosystem II biosynthesis protein [Ulvibacterium marinum]|uniref:photosystem II biosynthesis protein n=1 Tax=Ulvibacterium marinum TaxID=2419782 RepID=UPI0024943ECB|nr:photosystem II biosynthesis protein [Ulvibacterium marinum]